MINIQQHLLCILTRHVTYLNPPLPSWKKTKKTYEKTKREDGGEREREREGGGWEREREREGERKGERERERERDSKRERAGGGGGRGVEKMTTPTIPEAAHQHKDCSGWSHSHNLTRKNGEQSPCLALLMLTPHHKATEAVQINNKITVQDVHHERLASLALAPFLLPSSLCLEPAVGISFWWPSGTLNSTHGLARPVYGLKAHANHSWLFGCLKPNQQSVSQGGGGGNLLR